jgi:hypothetical protein
MDEGIVDLIGEVVALKMAVTRLFFEVSLTRDLPNASLEKARAEIVAALKAQKTFIGGSEELSDRVQGRAVDTINTLFRGLNVTSKTEVRGGN